MDNDELNRPLDHSVGLGSDADTELVLRRQLLGRLIVGQTIAVSLLTVMTIAGGILMPDSGLLALMPLGAIAIVVGVVSFWLLRQGWLRMGSYVFLLGTALAITYNVYVRGYQDASAIYYLWPILGAAVLLEARGSVPVAVVCAMFYAVLVTLQVLGVQSAPMPYDPSSESLLTVGSRLLMFFLVAFLGWLSSRNLRQSLRQARQAALDLGELNETLERRVTDRTRELERRSRYLEAATSVARDTTVTLDPQELLSRVASLISVQFGFYHVGLFLLDDSGEWAELQAASSEGGRRMLARGHRLQVGEQGIVGYVAGRGQARVALDVGADAAFFDNPDLPETRSEIALPLRARGEVIGVLDVQSAEPEAFGDEDVTVLQTLADQVAVAISNARLFEEAQEAVHAERRARGELSREAWQRLLRAQGGLGFLSDRQRTVPMDRPDQVEVATALRTAQASVDEEDGTRLAIPIRVGGHVIGVVHGSKLKSAGRWTPDEISMLDALTDQLSQAAERARLYRETQRNAARERVVAQVGARVRASLDLEAMLRTAASEMRQALNLGDLVIRLAPPDAGSGSDEGRT